MPKFASVVAFPVAALVQALMYVERKTPAQVVRHPVPITAAASLD